MEAQMQQAETSLKMSTLDLMNSPVQYIDAERAED